MDTVVFVHGKPPMGRVPRGKDAQVVALDLTASFALSAAGIAHKTPSAYTVPDNNVRATDVLNAWSSKPLAGGKTIKDLLAHDGFSFWWCMEEWLFYSFLYRDPMNKIMLAVDLVKAVLAKERPAQVAFIDDGTLYSRAIPLVAKAMRVSTRPIRVARPLRERITERLRPFAIRRFLRWHTRARRAVWRALGGRRKTSIPVRGKHVLAICSYQWRTVEHPALAQPVLGDPYLVPITAQLRGSTVTYVDATQREYRGFGALRAKARSADRHILLEQYLTLQHLREVRAALAALSRVARALEQSDAFRKSWEFDGIDLWPLIGPQFRCYFEHRLEGHLLDFVCAKAVLERERPDAAIYPCESGDLAYIFFKLCADRGIPCVGIQHGTMSYSPLSVHLPEEMCAGKPACLPRPTRLLLYGPYYRDFLVSHGGYPRDEITVIGNLRYDEYAGAQKLAREEMAQKYGFDGRKPIILYATQFMPTLKEGEEITRAVFRAAKELGLPLVVKQHPGEPSDVFYHALAREMGMRPLIIKHTPTRELITATDVMIGSESTLNYEAMILGQPIIIVNFGGGRKDWMSFAQDGAALGVYRPEDVVPALKKALYDQRVRAELDEGMRKLFAAHCYKADGKAAERAVAAVQELIA